MSDPTPNYQVCAEATNFEMQVGSGIFYIHLVKLDESGKCLTGDDAMKDLLPVEKAYYNGMVNGKICQLLIAAGKCPKKMLMIR